MNRLKVVLCCLVVAAASQVVMAQPAFTISCEGTESTGGGATNYQYTLKNNSSNPIVVTVLEVASNDPALADYSNWTMPAGFVVQLTPNTAYQMAKIKTPHGTVSPGPTVNPPVYVQWANPNGVTLPSGQTLGPFGFDHPWRSADSEWMASGTISGVLTMTVANWLTPVAGPINVYTDGPVHAPFETPSQPTMHIEFSLDIGSDKELSDPQMDGDEAFDPGDVYLWRSAPVLPPGANGFKDDFSIFGFDPVPTPGVAGSRVPVGQKTSPPDPPEQWYPQFFDLDGHDQIDVSLEQVTLPHEQFESDCIHEPQYMFISYDDDRAPGWMQPLKGDVPVNAFSPAGLIYGTTLGKDEVKSVTLAIGPPPVLVAGIFPLLHEIGVHQSLTRNPDPGNPQDDDVDSLDIVETTAACPYWYFTADHEATNGLDPGDIYQVWPGGPPIRVIDNWTHLGLPNGTDVDAFEFTWLDNPDGSGKVLGILFSVDEDDPLTLLVNESGLLNPRMIYASILNGNYYPYLQQPLEDDVDAIALWSDRLDQLDLNPPVVMSAVSRKLHGTIVGSLDIDVLTPMGTSDIAVEDRVGGPQELHVWFDELIFGVGGLDPSDVTIVDTAGSVITIGPVAINNTELIINFTGVANISRVRVRFPGIQDAWGNVCTDTFCFGALVGDANGTRNVNAFDINKVRAVLGQPVSATYVREDVNPSGGTINAFDINAVRARLGNVLPVTCPP